jgi:hypothetical protein
MEYDEQKVLQPTATAPYILKLDTEEFSASNTVPL